MKILHRIQWSDFIDTDRTRGSGHIGLALIAGRVHSNCYEFGSVLCWVWLLQVGFVLTRLFKRNFRICFHMKKHIFECEYTNCSTYSHGRWEGVCTAGGHMSPRNPTKIKFILKGKLIFFLKLCLKRIDFLSFQILGCRKLFCQFKG